MEPTKSTESTQNSDTIEVDRAGNEDLTSSYALDIESDEFVSGQTLRAVRNRQIGRMMQFEGLEEGQVFCFVMPPPTSYTRRRNKAFACTGGEGDVIEHF